MTETQEQVNIEALVKDDDLSRCRCITKPITAHRVLRTQNGGRILEHPVSLGDFVWRHDAVEVAEANRGDGTYAIIVPVYECEHDHTDWTRFWDNR